MGFISRIERRWFSSDPASRKRIDIRLVWEQARNQPLLCIAGVVIPYSLAAGFIAISTNTNSEVFALIAWTFPSWFYLSNLLICSRLTSVKHDELMIASFLMLLSPAWILTSLFVGLCLLAPILAGGFWGLMIGVAYGNKRSVDIGLIIGTLSLVAGMFMYLASLPNDVRIAFTAAGFVFVLLTPLCGVYLALAHKVANRSRNECSVCSYSLDGLHSGTCPECGSEITILPSCGGGVPPPAS